jgi:2-keto-4-pentenoate hydratase
MAFSIAKVANWLHQVHRSRAVVGWWPDQFALEDERIAYKVQDALLKKLVPKQGPLVGYKIALTSPQIWEQTGLRGPAYGPIRKKRVFEHKASVRADRWARLGVELEIILTANADVPRPKDKPYDKDSIAPYVGEARAGFELIEDRGADYSRLSVPWLVMDVGWNGGSLLAKANKGRLDRLRRQGRAQRSFRRRAGPLLQFVGLARQQARRAWQDTEEGHDRLHRQHGRLPVRAARQHRRRPHRGLGRSDAQIRIAALGKVGWDERQRRLAPHCWPMSATTQLRPFAFAA